MAGEGPHDIGRWAQDPAWHGPGVSFVEALLATVVPTGWVVEGGRPWRKIPKHRSGDRRSAEERNVLGALALARHAGCDVLVFLRDDDHEPGRAEALNRGVAGRREDDPQVVPGIPVRTVDSWCLAILGVARSEDERRPKDALAAHDVRTAAERVALVEERGLGDVPADARSLMSFRDSAVAAFGRR